MRRVSERELEAGWVTTENSFIEKTVPFLPPIVIEFRGTLTMDEASGAVRITTDGTQKESTKEGEYARIHEQTGVSR